MQEMWVRSLGWDDPLEKATATDSSILVWEIHRLGSLVGYSPWGNKKVGYNLATKEEQQHFKYRDGGVNIHRYL